MWWFMTRISVGLLRAGRGAYPQPHDHVTSALGQKDYCSCFLAHTTPEWFPIDDHISNFHVGASSEGLPGTGRPDPKTLIEESPLPYADNIFQTKRLDLSLEGPSQQFK
jgi:hypothetical protein